MSLRIILNKRCILFSVISFPEYTACFNLIVLLAWSKDGKIDRGGGVLTLTWYTYMCLPFGALFPEIWYSNRGVSSEIKEPKLHKLGVFWAIYCKKHPI